MSQFNNADAAGPYDGEWPVARHQPVSDASRPLLDSSIEGRVVLGQTKFERDAPNINGTADENGTFGGLRLSAHPGTIHAG
jgi:hypothetical protein